MADPQYPADVKNQVYAEIDKYDVRFNENGDLLGDVRVNGFVPTSDWATDAWCPRVVLVSVWNWVASLWAT